MRCDIYCIRFAGAVVRSFGVFTQVVGCFNLQLIVGGVSLLLPQSDFWLFLNSGIIEGGSSWGFVRMLVYITTNIYFSFSILTTFVVLCVATPLALLNLNTQFNSFPSSSCLCSVSLAISCHVVNIGYMEQNIVGHVSDAFWKRFLHKTCQTDDILFLSN